VIFFPPIPIQADNPMERVPFANWVIIGLNVILFFIAGRIVLNPQDITLVGLVAHMFAHADIFHLAGNMLFLFVFGNNINARLGTSNTSSATFCWACWPASLIVYSAAAT
jgi:membrane associated rhomboid family serine protease